MRINKNFVLHDVCGLNVIIAEGVENIDFSKIIQLNETAAFLWNKAYGHDFTVDGLTDALCGEYEVAREQALTDVTAIVNQWREVGLLEKEN
jgi:hypothetical protein